MSQDIVENFHDEILNMLRHISSEIDRIKNDVSDLKNRQTISEQKWKAKKMKHQEKVVKIEQEKAETIKEKAIVFDQDDIAISDDNTTYQNQEVNNEVTEEAAIKDFDINAEHLNKQKLALKDEGQILYFKAEMCMFDNTTMFHKKKECVVKKIKRFKPYVQFINC